MEVGALYRAGTGCTFRVWAPFSRRMSVHILSPHERIVPMEQSGKGYWCARLPDIAPGTRYLYMFDDGSVYPDPASRYQPDDVHGPSEVFDPGAFDWTDGGWSGVSPDHMVLYEIHTGTFTPAGTFAAAIDRLDALRDMGITAINLMPVAQFPGTRNWGYDGVYPYAVHTSYGGPAELQSLVNACHEKGLAILLDVVYNHLGPEGNYLGRFGPYYTDRYRTPWGAAINYDGEWSDEVRNYFIENALYWLHKFHFDGLRLDAVHGIYDFSAQPFLAELTARVAELDRNGARHHHIIAESDLNDPVVIRSRTQHGWGCDAQWCDDYHHALHAVLTGERDGYYGDFGTMADLAKSLRDGYVYDGRYSEFRKRHHGSPANDAEPRQFVVFSQNHDHIGNRMHGERLTELLPFPALKLAAAAIILSPYVPLLFMGEEYGEPSPFQYFVSHHDQALIDAIRAGRQKEFTTFHTGGEIPDPAEYDTFMRSKLEWERRESGFHAQLLRWYTALISLRETYATIIMRNGNDIGIDCNEDPQTLIINRAHEGTEFLMVLHFGKKDTTVSINDRGTQIKILDAADQKFGGGGGLPETIEGGATIRLAPYACAVYLREQ